MIFGVVCGFIQLMLTGFFIEYDLAAVRDLVIFSLVSAFLAFLLLLIWVEHRTHSFESWVRRAGVYGFLMTVVVGLVVINKQPHHLSLFLGLLVLISFFLDLRRVF